MGVIITHSNQGNRSVNYFPNHKMLTAIGSNFPDFIEGFDFSVHLKDAQTGKYILSNSHNRVLHKGIENLRSPDDLVGLTADDLCYLPPDVRKRMALKIDINSIESAFTEAIKKLDYEAQALQYEVNSNRQSPAVEKQLINCLREGFIEPINTIKRPIFSQDKRKTVAILTFDQDLTSQYSLSGLFQLYREYYFDEQAIELLLKHLKIDHYFIKLPTLREMQILLAMHQHACRKRIAKLLNISTNTVASHLQHLKEYKLIKPDFDEVLMQLRKAPMDKRPSNPICVPENA